MGRWRSKGLGFCIRVTLGAHDFFRTDSIDGTSVHYSSKIVDD